MRSRGRTGGPGAKLKLSQQTPPGSYVARIVADEGSYDAQIEVQPAMRVAVNPPELSFSGKAGARATFATTLSNMGNVPVTIPKTAPLGIFDDDGVETALSAAYGQKFEDVNDFFKTVIGRLNTAHGGVIKLVSTKGAGTHDPGATVLWEIEAEYPESLPRGHRFHGVWTTDFGNLAVSLFVEK